MSALHREAKRLGARILTGSSVTALGREGDGFAVDVAAGERLRAGRVVNAASADAREIGAMLGLDVPVTPYRRNLAHVQDEPGPLAPMCVDLDTGVLVRRDAAGGWVVAYSNPNDPPSRETSVDPAFLGDLAERIGHRFPFLEDVPIDPKNSWAGLYPETPDHHAIVGEDPAAPGFLQCVGFGGHGTMHAPAAGRAIAELVTADECRTFDLHPLRLARFAEGDLIVETAVL